MFSKMLQKIKRAYEEAIEIKVTVQVQHTYQYVEGLIVYFDEEVLYVQCWIKMKIHIIYL